jgi:hypothetical protein
MKEPVSRRNFLAGTCGLFLLSGIQALPASANSAVKKLANGKLSVQLSKIEALAQVGGAVRVGIIKGNPVAITRTGLPLTLPIHCDAHTKVFLLRKQILGGDVKHMAQSLNLMAI